MYATRSIAWKIGVWAIGLSAVVASLALWGAAKHYRRNAALLAAIQKADATVETESLLPEWLDDACWSIGLGEYVYYCGDVVTICMSDTNVADRDVQFLPSAKALRTLILGDNAVTADGLSVLEGMRTLKDVVLLGPAGKGIGHLRDATQLELLCVRTADLQDSDLDVLSAFERLKTLYLKDTLITDRGVELIAKMRTLSDLNLRNSRISDDGVRQIGTMATIESLELAGCAITDRAADYISEMPALRELTICKTGISFNGLLTIMQNRTVRKITVDHAQVAAWDADRLKDFGRLEELVVSCESDGCDQCTEFTTALGQYCPLLQVQRREAIGCCR